MSLTSYRAAPPRGGRFGGCERRSAAGRAWARKRVVGGGRGPARAAGSGAPRALCPGLATTRSPTLRRAVPWARCGFTAEFGMGSGGARTLWSPSRDKQARGPRAPATAGRRSRARAPGAGPAPPSSVKRRAWGAPAPGAHGALGAGRGRAWLRAIRTGQLHALPRLHSRPIDVVVDHGSRRDLVWRRVSRLDAFSGYPDRT